jgi:anti-sigma factor RsiW
VRGYHVVMWRADGLGHALVSDVNPAELRELAVKFASAQ